MVKVSQVLLRVGGGHGLLEQYTDDTEHEVEPGASSSYTVDSVGNVT